MGSRYRRTVCFTQKPIIDRTVKIGRGIHQSFADRNSQQLSPLQIINSRMRGWSGITKIRKAPSSKATCLAIKSGRRRFRRSPCQAIIEELELIG